jgi:acylphosphatase
MKRKYKLNCNYFDAIDTHDKAYILGILAADGYNNNKDGEVVIGQAGDNKEILEKIKNYIGSNQPISCIKRGNKNHQNFYTLPIYSRKISDKLSEIGIVQNKSHVLSFPTIDEELDSSFILGYFDGDGSISIDEKRYFRGSINFTGNKLIIETIQNKIKKITNYKGYISIRNLESPNIISLSYSGTKSVVSILSWLYSKSNIYLDRKYKKFCILKNLQQIRENKKKEKLENQRLENEIKSSLKEDEYKNIIKLLDQGYSIRQLSIQFNIDKRKTRKVINETNYEYPERRRMYIKDPNTFNTI